MKQYQCNYCKTKFNGDTCPGCGSTDFIETDFSKKSQANSKNIINSAKFIIICVCSTILLAFILIFSGIYLSMQ